MLEETHFNFNNTEGDSGKTAVINALGMTTLVPVFVDLAKCPYSAKGPTYSSTQHFYARVLGRAEVSNCLLLGR